MYKQTRKLVLASAITLALATISGTAFAAATDQDVIEARLESQIVTTYTLSPYLRANDIKVTVDGETATLTGTVAEDVNKDLAKQIALGVNGIKKVDNNIEVNPDYTPAARTSTDRSFGEVVDDASITTAVKSKLLWSKNTEGLEINVDTDLGKVTLVGTAKNGAAKELAGRMAQNTHGVVSVDNKLVVDKAPAVNKEKVVVSEPENSAPEKPNAISDSWITTKVKSTFMYSSNVQNSAISVSTSAGVVTLSGKVRSGAERELAIELADNVRGVKSVDGKALTF